MKAGTSAPMFVRAAFSLLEMLVSVAVLGLLVLLVGQLFNGATLATTSVNKHIDCDTQARAVFERMASDFAQMLRRPDVDYYLKDDADPQAGIGGLGKNDQIACFSQVPGNISATANLDARSPLSLIAYRIAPNPLKLQRMGIGLLWDDAPPHGMIYSARSTSSGSNTIANYWPSAANQAPEPNYESMGPDIFRLEYFYILKSPVQENGRPMLDSNNIPLQSKFSGVPWDIRIPGHNSINGLRDVSAITVVIGVVDPKSRVTGLESDLLSLSELLPDFTETMLAGDLETSWRNAVDGHDFASIRPSSIRFYSRCFYLQ